MQDLMGKREGIMAPSHTADEGAPEGPWGTKLDKDMPLHNNSGMRASVRSEWDS